jgi:hypothetical protein
MEEQTSPSTAAQTLTNSLNEPVLMNRADRRRIQAEQNHASRRAFTAYVRELRMYPPTPAGFNKPDFLDCMWRLSLLLTKSVEEVTEDFKKLAVKFPRQSWIATYRGLMAHI